MFDLTPFAYRQNNFMKVFDDFEKNFFKGFESEALNIRTDILDKGDKFMLLAELPGYTKEDISIDVNENRLTINASHNEENEEKDAGGNFIRRERRYGSFSRSFDISNIKADEIKAEYKNGILELALPKIDIAPPKQYKIDIN